MSGRISSDTSPSKGSRKSIIDIVNESKPNSLLGKNYKKNQKKKLKKQLSKAKSIKSIMDDINLDDDDDIKDRDVSGKVTTSQKENSHIENVPDDESIAHTVQADSSFNTYYQEPTREISDDDDIRGNQEEDELSMRQSIEKDVDIDEEIQNASNSVPTSPHNSIRSGLDMADYPMMDDELTPVRSDSSLDNCHESTGKGNNGKYFDEDALSDPQYLAEVTYLNLEDVYDDYFDETSVNGTPKAKSNAKSMSPDEGFQMGDIYLDESNISNGNPGANTVVQLDVVYSSKKKAKASLDKESAAGEDSVDTIDESNFTQHNPFAQANVKFDDIYEEEAYIFGDNPNFDGSKKMSDISFSNLEDDADKPNKRSSIKTLSTGGTATLNAVESFKSEGTTYSDIIEDGDEWADIMSKPMLPSEKARRAHTPRVNPDISPGTNCFCM